MARRKLKVKRIDFMVTQSNYEKLLILCNEERTLTDVLNDCIQWKYGALYESKKQEDPIIKKKLDEMTKEEKEKYELANLNWLEGDSNA